MRLPYEYLKSLGQQTWYVGRSSHLHMINATTATQNNMYPVRRPADRLVD